MASYRFCRPDDVPMLVRAVNDCFMVHFPGLAPLTLESYRKEMKHISVWPSSCMVAVAGDDPIAVLIGTKRSHETLVLRVGVHPEHLRQGHGIHLVTSLSQKLAVLGPPRLAVEVPLDLPGVDEFFSAAGYEREMLYVDWTRPPDCAAGGEGVVPEELVIPITVQEAADAELLEIPEGVAWERTRETLEGSQGVLEGWAIATPERIEACVFFRSSLQQVEVVSARCLDPSKATLLLGLLLRYLIGRSSVPVCLPKLYDGEFPPDLLEELGFEAGRSFARASVAATPG